MLFSLASNAEGVKLPVMISIGEPFPPIKKDDGIITTGSVFNQGKNVRENIL